MSAENTHHRAPLTKVEYPYEYRFQMPPPPPSFGVWGSLASISSLVLMTLLSTVMLLQLLDPSVSLLAGMQAAFENTAFGTLLLWLAPPSSQSPLPAWTWVPFAFTIFGAGLGALFELYLLIDGKAFQQTSSKGTTFVLKIRLLNLAPVTASILFFITCMLVHEPSLRLALLLGSGFLCFALGMALFFGGAEKVVPLVMIGIQALGAIMVLVADVPLAGEHVKMFLLAQPILQTIALLIGTSTPGKSTAFHLIATASGVMLYCALLLQTAASPNFAHAVAVDVSPGSLRFWAFLTACVVGLLFTARMSPRTYNAYRTAMSDGLWSPIYFLLVSAPRFPNPINLSEVYKQTRPEPAILRPYYVNHPQFLPEPLSIPSVEKLEPGVLAFQDAVKKAKQTFAFIALGDHNFPQANSKLPLAEKPRLEVWSNGSNYWPGIYRKKLFGLSLPQQEAEVAPPAAVEAYKAGQQLAYLCESGVGATMLARSHEEGELVLDLRFLEIYETKPDYEPYGGQAFFYIDAKSERLVLRSVIAPRTRIEILANPEDATFRRAEAMVIASLYYYVVSGKHLTEIHMTYNLVEAAMYNAFDAQGQWTHPFRTALYLHTFSHELAEELTTEHLVQDGAVFTQIFATTHSALIQHLNDGYEAFEYGKDEEFETRTELFSIKTEAGERKLLPNAAITWELELVAIWTRYADALVDIIYEDDAAVLDDRYIQDFFQELSVVLSKPLPPRYAKLTTKAGVSRFMSDTIHHLVVRHQVYGTTGVPGLDPRIATTQVPRDGGTTGVDEWRSLASVALATAHARFVLLLGDFKYLLDGVDAKYKNGMRDVFDKLQEDLQVLDAEWTTTDESKAHNRNYFRAVPSDMHTGPGY
jgi:hypothetical protein